MTDRFRLLGIEPSTEGGRYFDDTKWWWHALWNYVYSVCVDILTEEDYIMGHKIENGYIITRDTALTISERLIEAIESGDCNKFEKEYMDVLNALPEERSPSSGEVYKPEEFMYPFTVDNVKTFAEFCHQCGGFVIENDTQST